MQPGRIAFVGLLCVLGVLPAHAATVTVVIEKMMFAPAEVSASVGDTIVWDNRDILQHTATAKDGSWNVLLTPGKKGSIVVRKAGAFDYFCKFHPNMTGRITVTSP